MDSAFPFLKHSSKLLESQHFRKRAGLFMAPCWQSQRLPAALPAPLQPAYSSAMSVGLSILCHLRKSKYVLPRRKLRFVIRHGKHTSGPSTDGFNEGWAGV